MARAIARTAPDVELLVYIDHADSLFVLTFKAAMPGAVMAIGGRLAFWKAPPACWRTWPVRRAIGGAIAEATLQLGPRLCS